jgi:hypothetical protein
MKSQLLTILLLLISSMTFAQFRNTTWGMSKEQVKKIEKEKLERDYDDKLKYEFLVEDFKVELSYLFNNDDQLQTIEYIFSSPIQHTFIVNGRYPIWDKTVGNIISKYGEPTGKPSEKVFTWDLKDFSIKAVKGVFFDIEKIEVIYTPPAPSLKDIL